ncbi:MAG: hypothetical protein NTX45_04745 [Proteobacteria bacterium]|nr:hypothetical protein [Pseudomonadota bacterium]
MSEPGNGCSLGQAEARHPAIKSINQASLRRMNPKTPANAEPTIQIAAGIGVAVLAMLA